MDDIALLRDFAPQPSLDATERQAARSALIGHIERASRPRRLAILPGVRRTRWTIALACVLLLAASAAIGAGAFRYLSEWGPVDHPATVEALDYEIEDTMAATPLPPGYAYPVEALRTLAEPPGNLTLFAGVQAVQFHAMCAWTGYWLDGHDNADKHQMARALATIEQFPTWQTVSDPRLADQSVRDEVASVIAGAREGKPAPVQVMYTGLMCDEALAR
jgi:hypothetical protein